MGAIELYMYIAFIGFSVAVNAKASTGSMNDRVISTVEPKKHKRCVLSDCAENDLTAVNSYYQKNAEYACSGATTF
jgi:hypothetical protein